MIGQSLSNTNETRYSIPITKIYNLNKVEDGYASLPRRHQVLWAGGARSMQGALRYGRVLVVFPTPLPLPVVFLLLPQSELHGSLPQGSRQNLLRLF